MTGACEDDVEDRSVRAAGVGSPSVHCAEIEGDCRSACAQRCAEWYVALALDVDVVVLGPTPRGVRARVELGGAARKSDVDERDEEDQTVGGQVSMSEDMPPVPMPLLIR